MDEDANAPNDENDEADEPEPTAAEKFIAALRRCGINNAPVVRAITVTQGVEDINDFSLLTIKEIEAMAYTISKTPRAANQGPIVISAIGLKKMKALREWVKWCTARGIEQPDPDEFTVITLAWSLKRMDFEERLKVQDLPSPTTPDKLKNVGHAAWIPFWKQFNNYCSSIRGCLKIPLSYIYRTEAVVTNEARVATYISSDLELIHTVALSGDSYNEDNRAVWDLLVPLITGGHAWPFIKKFESTQDGRRAIIALKNQSEGTDSESVRKSKAYAILDNTSYTGKNKNFTFSNYVERLQYAFSELEECNEEVPPSKQIDILLRQATSPLLDNARDNLRGEPDKYETFMETSEYLSNILAHRSSHDSSANHRNVSSVGSNSNLKTSYTSEEWRALPQATKDKVIKKRKDEKAKGGKKTNSTGSSTLNPSAPTTSKGFKRRIKALNKKIHDLEGTDGNNGDSSEESDSAPPTTNDSSIKSTTTKKSIKRRYKDISSNYGSDRSVFSIERKNGQHSVLFSTFSRGSSDRTELDSHADTCVGGSNSILLDPSGETATVHSFSDERKPFAEIPIGTIATSWTSEVTGETFVLRFPESLFFGDRLPTTLLCPNQMRGFGVIVEDTPRQFNKESRHSLTVDGFSIPLHLDGVISYLTTTKPTADELLNCSHLTLTSNEKWNPRDPGFAAQEKAAWDSHDSELPSHRVIKSVYNDIYLPPEWTVVEDNFLAPEWQSPSDFYHRLLSAVYTCLDDDCYLETFGLDERFISGMTSLDGKSILTKDILARRWNIGVKAADMTLRATSQRGLRSFLHPTDRRLPSSHPHLSYPVIKRRMYSDTMFSKIKSLQLHSCAQVWTDGKGYSLFYPLKTKSQAWTTVSLMIADIEAIPTTVITDGAAEETGGPWKKEMQHYRIKQKWSEPYTQWQNKAESEIRELKRMIRKSIQRELAPKRLWDFCGQWSAAIRRRTALDISDLNEMTPMECVHGRVVDISAYAQFNWYSLVWYIDYPKDTATSKRQIGRWLGVAENTGSSLCYVVLPKSCKPICRSSVMPISPDELLQPEIKALVDNYDAIIKSKIGDDRSDEEVDAELPNIPQVPPEIFVDDDLNNLLLNPIDSSPEVELAEADDWTPESFDNYISAQLLLPIGDTFQRATVMKRARDLNDNPVGIRNNNPILDTREYQVQFADGSFDTLSANAIAEAMYSQVDDQGYHHQLLKEISDHRKDGSAVHADDGMVPGTQQKRWTTKGWFLLVEWKDGGTNWIPLKDLKESNPIEVAEYAVANKLVTEPAFAWWVAKFLRLRDRNIMKVRTRHVVRTHKFGIEIPRTIKRALQIDAETKTDFWRKAIEKEMRNNFSAFEILEDGKVPPGWLKITCHMIFDIKMDFTRKARFVAGGHLTEPPKESVYSSVVSRESVRLFFLIAALNDLDILSCDVQNAYLNAGTKEKNWFIAGLEFGPSNVGKQVLIVKALYGLRSSGAQWREHMANTLRAAGFSSCKADPDVWLRPAVKADGSLYYEYVLCYVDDILCGSEHPQRFMDYLASVYTLKAGSVKEPDVYLGADIKKINVGVHQTAWGISSDTYVKTAVCEVERKLSEVGKKLTTGKCATPMTSGYRPELDSSPQLRPDQANYFQSLIGVLRWAVELGRIDIIVETSMLSRYCVSPRLGHLEQVLHIFAYLKRQSSCCMVFDSAEPVIDEQIFPQRDWSTQYPDAAEAIPPNMPKARGKSVVTRCFVDADHAGCLATRRSTTGVIIYVNKAPIIWYSKRQNTVESSTFGSEFIALRQAIDLIEGLRYKLRMMGVEIDDSTSIYCDNEAVVKSTTAPESTLKKKHNAICYHRAREAQASGHVRVGKILGTDNRADVFTKVLVGAHRQHLLSMIFYYPPGVGNFGNFGNLKDDT